DISITEGVNNPTAYTVSLGSLPTANVTITITEASNAINVENPTLTFTPLNWNTPQSVSVTGSQDANTVNEVDQTITFDPSSADSGYNALPNQTRNADVTDNDTPSFVITPVSDLSMTEGATNSTAYQVVLGTEPASNVVIDITESSPQITLNTTSLTFTSGNWNVAQNVSVTATEDSNPTNEQDQVITFAINDTSSDNQFDPLANQTRQIDFIDNDIPSFSITQTGGNTSVVEEGVTDTFSIVLGSQPSGNVVIDVSSSDTTALTLSAPDVSFNIVNWNTPQPITVTGPHDPDTDSENITITASIDQALTLDTNYDTLPAQNFSASVTDNDIPVDVIIYENKFPPINTSTVTQRKSGSLIVGGFRSTDYVRLDSLIKIPDGAGNGLVLTSNATGEASWAPTGSSSGSTTWGSITGTLADQYDLQNALNLKASLNSPQFIGEPKSNETLALNDNDTSVATTAFVQSKIGAGTGGANGWSDTGNQVSLITSSDNISIGEASIVYKGGYSNSNRFIHNSGLGNTFLGLNSGSLNLSGQYNTAVGNDSLLALDTILTGEKNTAFGYKALSVADSFTSNNTAIGSKALGLGGGGVYNTALGYETLLNTYTTNGNSTGVYNTAVGYQALRNNTTGSYNVAVGSGALINNTTGSYNIAIGYGAGPTTSNLFNTVAIGYGTTVAQSNKIRLGNTSISTVEFQVAPTVVSDLRLKENINDTDLGLEFIKKLRPVSYTMKDGTGIDYGFIAQEVEEVIGKKTNIVLTDNTEFRQKSMRYEGLIAPLVKAVQEQDLQLENDKKELEDFAKRLVELENKLK
ncbi:MAG: tail fiber domain-containing protein, partial [Candidatus Pacebacteria bacterium]|nr:tail fiber domain-containing protein [Candidatus Paceibacterota bacterium]